MSHCRTCKRKLNDESEDVRDHECRGECLQCAAEAGDPECLFDLADYLRDQFWENFRWLVRETLDQFPEHVGRDYDLRDRLQESTSCYHPGIPDRGERRK